MPLLPNQGKAMSNMEEYCGITKDEAFELLPNVRTFAFGPEGDESYLYEVSVSYRGKGKYAVIHMNNCWDGSDWVYEPMSSSRTDEFIEQTRFSLRNAIDIAKTLVPTISINGMTWEELQEWKRKLNAKR